MLPGVQVVHVPGRPARRRCPRTSCCPTCPPSAGGWAGSGPPGRRPTSCTRTSGCPGWPPARRPAAVPVPLVQTFHALGSVKRRHQGAADTSPAGPGAAGGATSGRRVDLVIATCSDEVDRAPPPRGARRPGARRALRGRRRALLPPTAPRRPLPTRTRGRGACRTGCCARPAGRAQGRRHRRRGARRAARRPSSSSSAGPPAERLDADPEVRRLRGAGRAPGVADRVRLLGAVAHADVPGAGPLGRRRRRRALVRAVRHRPARGHGLRPAGRGHRRRRPARHRARRRHRPARPAARPRRPRRRPAARCSPTRRGAAASAPRPGAAPSARYGWDRVAARTERVYRGRGTFPP